jgi:nuclear factor 4
LTMADAKDTSSVVKRSAKSCRICGDVARCKNFGVLTCPACSNFFRRSMMSSKRYKSRCHGDCDLSINTPNHLCKYCRYQRCVQLGMSWKPETIKVIGESSSSSESYVKRLLHNHQSTLHDRIRATAAVYGGDAEVERMVNKPTNYRASSYAIMAEFRVLHEFIRRSEMLDAHMSDIVLTPVCLSFLYTWIVFESARNTMRHLGFSVCKGYFVDESYAPLNEDFILDRYRQDPSVRMPDAVGRHGLEVYSAVTRLGAKFYEARLDEVELAVLAQLLLLNASTHLSSGKCLPHLTEYRTKLFKELKSYYGENYGDIAVRFGALIFLIEEVQRVRNMFDEHVIMLKISGMGTALDKVRSQMVDGAATDLKCLKFV